MNTTRNWTTTARTNEQGPIVGEAVGLVNDWAGRVLALWEQSRQFDAPDRCWGVDELVASYRIRDEIDNRIQRGLVDVSAAQPDVFPVLRAADDLLLQFTIEARTPEALTVLGHYPRRSEWWWQRLPRRGPVYDELSRRTG